MKNFLQIVVTSLLTIVFLSSAGFDNRLNRTLPFNSSPEYMYDTSGLDNLIRIDSFKLPIIPPSSGVQFFEDRIVFLSMAKLEKNMSPTQISFGAVEAYYASVQDSVSGTHVIFSSLSSFSYPCEAITFNQHYNRIYFSKVDKKAWKEKIYTAEFEAKGKNQPGVVTNVLPLDFCTGNSNYSHPALSPDENMLIFASDRAGGYGGMDLYVSMKSDGKWAAPENLGSSINTVGNEFFPFLDSENNLYFSSDKLPGNGGYDIFSCKFNGTGWDKPANLPGHINSTNDDIAFTINKNDGKTAFLTRRQKSGKGETQLFRVSLKKEVADNNLLTLSYIFNGKAVPQNGFVGVNKVNEVKTTETKPIGNKTAENKLVEIKPPATRPVETKPAETKLTKVNPVEQGTAKTIPSPAVNSKMTDTKTATEPSSSIQKDVVIYRVQLLPDRSQINAKEMGINGTNYKIYEYTYLGAQRYTIGEFSGLSAAAALQRICRQSGYPQSFVVAFKNNARSLDQNLFK